MSESALAFCDAVSIGIVGAMAGLALGFWLARHDGGRRP